MIQFTHSRTVPLPICPMANRDDRLRFSLLNSSIFTSCKAHSAFRTPHSAFFYSSLIFSTILFLVSFLIFVYTLSEQIAKRIRPNKSVTQGLNTRASARPVYLFVSTIIKYDKANPPKPIPKPHLNIERSWRI